MSVTAAPLRGATHLVVGAGAAGMAFTDALIDHGDARVVLVDRRPGPGGHWRDAYPFVRLHQASCFYGVASTPLGGGRLQADGPERGLHERATGAEVVTYYEQVLDRLLATGRVTFLARSSWDGARLIRTPDGGEHPVPGGCRVVDATYHSGAIPATSPPPFDVLPGSTVVPVNAVLQLPSDLPEVVVVGSGKTATDACVQLLEQGVPASRITWVRPREPWMLNRAVVQPEPAVFQRMVADQLEAVASSSGPDDLFRRLEDAGIMLRVDPGRTPTMARTPTLAVWELELLRSVTHVVRLGRVRAVAPGLVELEEGTLRVDPGAVVVHCAAPGLSARPLVPVWDDVVRLQSVVYPCFGAALSGYLEATRSEDPEKNRLCLPTPEGDSLADWCWMQLRSAHAVAALATEPDAAAWAAGTTLNLGRVPPGQESRPAVSCALERSRAAAPGALEVLARYAGERR
ncbi:MAG: pyridine nucleotide-disulfide oxidoreductase [Acidobacteria bacterium]|nr:MAG: pyridine nucleotide-disulfide oxidoreductase [Acidobacteriota bacterium]